MNEEELDKEKSQSQLLKAGSALLVGGEMAAAVAIGFLLGQYLDKKLGTAPWLTIAFFAIGAISAFRLLFQRVKMLK